jgi:thiamine biosynthesis lipoprotein
MMAALSRRRFLTITAAVMATGPVLPAEPLRQWRGSALGARATISLDHPDGARIARTAFAEIDRLENIFSLYRAGSALSRLNRDGVLADPPFELLECLGQCGTVHRATDGLFDPTIQPLWALYAESFAGGRAPSADEITDRLKVVGWGKVAVDATGVRLPGGGALTLNGIAQGYIADRIAGMLRSEGLRHVLIDTGELHAMGGDWPVSLRTPSGAAAGAISLRDQALASSAPLGTVFSGDGKIGHILDPRDGKPARAFWQLVSVTAPRAALADALSTALVLMDRRTQERVLSAVPTARLVAAVAGSETS